MVQAEVQSTVSVVGTRASMIGIPFPGTFILDTQGRVKQRFFEDFYRERNTVSSLLIKLGDKTAPPVPATKISTAHFDITTYPSDAGVAPGGRFSVELDIEPRSSVHVYAPGAKGYPARSRYRSEPHPQVRVLPMRYPDSENLFL